MITKYICPDGIETPISCCLEGCRISQRFEAERCLSHRTLKAISMSVRGWTGIPSVTQLLSGTREEYLKITKEYAIDPQQSIFGIFGTGCHAYLEQFLENEKMLVEKRLTDPTGSYTGQFDCYDGKRQILYDVKTYGSFKTSQALGLTKHKEVLLNEKGEPSLRKNGKKIYRTYFTNEGHRSVHDVAIQLNAYRLMLESAGFPVKKMIVEIFTRDSGTYSARDRGIFNNMQLLPIRRISNRWIQKYLLTKAKRLKEALSTQTMPPVCRSIESWNGKKCKEYCAVWRYCEEGRRAHR